MVYQEGDNMETVGVVSWGIAGCPADGASVMARLNLRASEHMSETHIGGGGNRDTFPLIFSKEGDRLTKGKERKN